MTFKQSEKIKRWIDLSKLPRLNNGNINWQKSVGIILPFAYNGISGQLEILEYVGKSKCAVLITTEHRLIECQVTSYNIKDCMLGDILKDPISVTNPELVKYFANINDTFKYSAYSSHKVDMICPICGTIKKQRISMLTSYGFGCPMCSDGISYPEKLMFNILHQSKLNFKNQITCATPGFEWIEKKYRYDFYIDVENNKYIIELDGHMHSTDRFESCEAIRNIDIQKDILAKEHGLSVIRIDCAYSTMSNRFEYIKSNIVNSKLNEFIDFSLIDWAEACKYASGSNVKLAADAWNNGAINSLEVGKLLMVSHATAQSYLKIASKLGMCDYNLNEANKRRGELCSETRKKKAQPFALFKHGDMVGVFRGITDIAHQSESLYGERLDRSNLYAVINGKRPHTKGYTICCITSEEYELFLPQFTNNTKLIK